MSRSVARGLLVASVLAVLLCAPAASSACECLDWLWPWNWGRGARAATTYAPPFAPAATVAPPFNPTCEPTCNPCTSQTCSYVPQTCYRQVCSTVPVTTCQAVTSCDPCTGCPVTSYRPVTVYRRATQLVPYTTYRMVWSNPCPTAPCATSCAPCGTSCGPGGCGTSAVSYGVPATGGSSCCGARLPVSSAAPLMPSPDPASGGAPPITFAPSNGGTTLPAPTQNGGTTLPPVQTRNSPVNDPNMAPKPENDKVQPNSGQSLQLNAPSTNLSASRTIRQVHYVSDSRIERPDVTTTGPVDFSGWRASSD